MKKVVLKVDLHDNKEKRKALKVVATLTGIDSLAMDMKDKKLTVTGNIDPVDVVNKLRKLWYTEILTVGPAKEDKKDDNKKDQQSGGAGKGGNKLQTDQQHPHYAYYYNNIPYAYPPPYRPMQYYVHCAEDSPNSCSIF